MNKKIILFGLLIIPLLASAQDEEFKTIFHNKNERIKISGFATPIMNFTAIDNDFAFMMGGGGAVMFGNVFLGGYGVGKTNDIKYKINEGENDEDYIMGMGHGGLWFGYIIKPKSAIHLSISSQVGWGAVTKKYKIQDETSENISSHPFTVITPIVEVEFNVSRFLKVGTGATWAFISKTPDYSSQELSKPSFFLTFKFGWFS